MMIESLRNDESGCAVVDLGWRSCYQISRWGGVAPTLWAKSSVHLKIGTRGTIDCAAGPRAH